ncbi:MAG: VWA domain-containing protein [Candidatus Reddybacter sp.]
MNLGLLEQEFSALDALPDALYDIVITHTHGPLLTRVRGILQWREKLIAGQLPEIDELCWPEETVRKTILMRIETLELASFCQGQENLTDSVLKDICEGISSAEDYLALTGNTFNDKLAQRQKTNEKDSSFRDEEGLADHVQSRTPQAAPHNGLPLLKKEPNKDTQRQSKIQSQNRLPPLTNSKSTTANQAVGADSVNTQQTQTKQNPHTAEQFEKRVSAGEAAVNHLQHHWQDIVNKWQQLSELDHQIDLKSKQQKKTSQFVLGSQGSATGKSLPGRGWDLSAGLLTSQGWRDIIRYRQRIKELPELIHFIDTIGRQKKIIGNDKSASVRKSPQNHAPSREQGEGDRSNKTPRKILEMDGIERGDDINRMLPSEMALLCHPILKTLWHAKRAERLLLLYQHQGKRGLGKKDEGARDKKGSLSEQGHKGKSSLGRGPIIICLDTSGSMHGEPEHIAKAVILEALKIAHREQRPCHLFAFSGPQQSTFHQLDLRRGGLIELLKFLQFSFHGGTDLPQALKLALEKQAEEGWQKADILLVSDGRFPLEKSTLKEIERYKKTRKLRVFGILTGNWQHDGVQAFCNDTLRIRC